MTSIVLVSLLVAAPALDFIERDEHVADGFDRRRSGPARALGHGTVSIVADGAVTVEHVFYENFERFVLRAEHSRIGRTKVSASDRVERGRVLGSKSGTVRLFVNDTPVQNLRRFLAKRQKLFDPTKEPLVLVVDHSSKTMVRFENGKRVGAVKIELGQASGRKRVRGDLRTPKGMYFVTNKHRGKFDGPYGDYYGGHWIKVNYPNPYDASFGRKRGWIGDKTARKIRRRWLQRKLTPQKTKLGGGIGFHGWAGPWTDGAQVGLSWGCVVMHNPDITKLFDDVPEGTMVLMQ